MFCSGRLLGCLEIQNGHKRLGMERTTTSSLVPFQPFQPGRNKLRHALSRMCTMSRKTCVLVHNANIWTAVLRAWFEETPASVQTFQPQTDITET